MPLKTTSDPVDYATFLRSTGLNPDTGTTPEAGDTSPPQNAEAPSFRIECTPSGGQFTARVIVDKDADEGSNTSIYLKEGVYETNSALYQQGMEKDKNAGEFKEIASYLEAFRPSSANRVYLYMPADVADLNRRAEVEHCQDLTYAYQQTLAVFQERLAAALPVADASEAAAVGCAS